MIERDAALDTPLDEPAPTVITLRGYRVITAQRCAEAFGVEVREITQNIVRNSEKFPERYAFQLTPDERDRLRSLGVIERRRGGGGALPWVLTQKGAIRLAMLMKSPKAMEAADLIVDVFAAVLDQAQAGRATAPIPSAHRLGADPAAQDQARRLRARLMDAITDLLDTVIDRRARTTVRDAIDDTATAAAGHLRAWLQRGQIGNEKIAAETLLILEQVQDLRERRAADLDAAALAREAKGLDNLERKIGIVRGLIDTLDRVEPNAVIGLIGGMAALPKPAEAQP